jgi:thioredoxin-dependent peroxiredoxin
MASVDDPETNKKFAEANEADFVLLSDPGKEVANAYGVIAPEKQFASRWTFYIGPDGKILYIDKQVKPGTSGEDMVAKLKELGVKTK